MNMGRNAVNRQGQIGEANLTFNCEHVGEAVLGSFEEETVILSVAFTFLPHWRKYLHRNEVHCEPYVGKRITDLWRPVLLTFLGIAIRFVLHKGCLLYTSRCV